MLCEHCKLREATVRYVEVVNGIKTEHCLCGHCASHLDIGQYSTLFEGEFSLGKLLSGLLGIQANEQKDGSLAGVVCPVCGTTYENFVEDSRFGCADCYSVFGPLLGENIRHLQGSERHVGKRPVSHLDEKQKNMPENLAEQSESNMVLKKEERIKLLQARLKDALRREDYEEAAHLRDEIRRQKEETE